MEKVFQKLASERLVSLRSAVGSSPSFWQLTCHGYQTVQASIQLMNPRRLMRTECSDKRQWSHYELLDFLGKSKWRLEYWPHCKGAKPTPYNLRTKSPMVYYVPSDGTLYIARSYLLCLALCSEDSFLHDMKTQGIDCIPHGMKVAWYDKLLDPVDSKPCEEGLPFEAFGTCAEGATSDLIQRTARLGNFRLAQSFTWHGISFKYKAPSGKRQQHGYQVDCPRRSHWQRKPRTTCSWTLHFNTPAEEAFTL
eukprot:1886039-Karenia_brevis.AAC.1